MTTLPRMSNRKMTFAQLQFENSKLRQRVRRLEDELRRYQQASSDATTVRHLMERTTNEPRS